MNRRMAFMFALDRVEVSGRARLTGLVLARFMGGADGSCYVGQRRLKADWAIRAERLNRDVAELVEAGLLDVSQRRGERGATIYRSRARFVDDSNLIVLDDGRELPARPTVGSLEDGQEVRSAPNVGRAGKKASVPKTERQRSHFEGPARPTVGTNHQTTRTISEGGGGGRSAPEATAPIGAASGEALEQCDPNRLEIALDLFDCRLSSMGKKAKLARLDQRLQATVAARLLGGWPAGALVDAACEKALPAKIGDLERFVTSRVELLPVEPTGVYAEFVAPLVQAQQEWLEAFSWADRCLWVSSHVKDGTSEYQRLCETFERVGAGDAIEDKSGLLDETCWKMMSGRPGDETWELWHAPSTAQQCRHEVSQLLSFCCTLVNVCGVDPHWVPPAKPIRTVVLEELQRTIERVATGELDTPPPPADETGPIPPAAPSEQAFDVGDVVDHKKFGRGRVVAARPCLGEPDKSVVVIEFDFEGQPRQRELMPYWASPNLTLVEKVGRA